MSHTRTNPRTRVRRTIAAAVLASTMALSAAACGDSAGSEGGAASAPQTASNGDVFNAADVQFASDMIQHHAQALSMVDLAVDRPLDPAVRTLTEQIRDAQAPEIEQMTDWLTAWDQKVPPTMRDHAHAPHHDMGDSGDMDGMDMGGSDTEAPKVIGGDMPGMMSSEDMAALAAASDEEFQDMWLQMMIEHHKGAIEMAKDEKANGTFADAIALADAIGTSQQAEIDQMEKLPG